MAIFDIEYGSDNGPLEELLLSVDRPGDFCTHGRLFAPMPRLEVDDVGLFSFPVPEAQVGALIAAAERAPYGKGPDTLVDTSVRDCRQIDAARIRVSGQAWGDTFKRILDQAATGLGCPSERLDARLYKLLVYEPGGFFTAHRDTEKMDGMVATLAISLPVAGAGGELVVRHREREVSIDLTAGEPSELAFAAFYADCAHEVRPVREGHRLSLVFNLCLRAGDEDSPRRAPDFTSQVDRIAERLVAWRDRDAASDKLVWVLDHDYSEAGLSFDTLKNVDAALARVLAPAAARAGCELYAAVVRATVHGDATYHGNYVDGWGEWGDEDAGDMEIDEVYESSIWLEAWVGQDGGQPPFEDVPVLPGELLPQGALDNAEPDEQRLHEATGNAGVSLERAYRHAALVVWPRSRTLDVIAGGGIAGAVAWVADELERSGGTADERIEQLVAKLIDLWPTHGDHDGDQPGRARMLDLLSRIGDEARTLRFLRDVVLSRYRRGDNERLPAAVRVVGPAAAGRFLSDLATAHVPRHTGAALALLRIIKEERREFAGGAWRDALRKSVQAALLALHEALAARTEDEKDEEDRGEEDDDPPVWASRRPGSSGGAPLRDLVVLGAGGTVRRTSWSLGDAAVRDLFGLAWLRIDRRRRASRLGHRPGPGRRGAGPHVVRGVAPVASGRRLGGHRHLRRALEVLGGFPARAQRDPARGAAGLEDCVRHRLRMRALRGAARILRESRRRGRAIRVARGIAPSSGADHPQAQARPRPRHRTQGPALYPRVHEEPRQLPTAVGRVRRGCPSHAFPDPFGAGRRAGRALRVRSRKTAGRGGSFRTVRTRAEDGHGRQNGHPIERPCVIGSPEDAGRRRSAPAIGSEQPRCWNPFSSCSSSTGR